MICIRGFAPPPPAQAFLCAPPPQALGASNPRHCAESCEKLRHRDKEYHDKEYHMCTARQPWRVNHDGLQSRSIIATGGDRAAERRRRRADGRRYLQLEGELTAITSGETRYQQARAGKQQINSSFCC